MGRLSQDQTLEILAKLGLGLNEDDIADARKTVDVLTKEIGANYHRIATANGAIGVEYKIQHDEKHITNITVAFTPGVDRYWISTNGANQRIEDMPISGICTIVKKYLEREKAAIQASPK